MPTYKYVACLKNTIEVIVKNVKITVFHLIIRKRRLNYSKLLK